MTNSNFLRADILALAVARHFEKQYGPSVVASGYAPKFDISFKSGVRVELKYDQSEEASGLAAIEFRDKRRDKATGVLETEADHWLHCIPEPPGIRCFLVQTKKLLRLCFEAGEVAWGGDFCASGLKKIELLKLKRIAEEDFLLSGPLIDFYLGTKSQNILWSNENG